MRMNSSQQFVATKSLSVDRSTSCAARRTAESAASASLALGVQKAGTKGFLERGSLGLGEAAVVTFVLDRSLAAFSFFECPVPDLCRRPRCLFLPICVAVECVSLRSKQARLQLDGYTLVRLARVPEQRVRLSRANMRDASHRKSLVTPWEA